MIGKKIILYLVLVATFLTGCDSAGTEVTVNNIGNVEGIVSEVGTGKPLSGVTVSVGSYSSITDANGVYTIKGLDVGSRTISASLSDYEAFSTSITINKGVTVTFNLSMTPSTIPLDDVGNIEGIVTDSDTGNPLSGVSVSVGSNSILTDSNGAYSFSDLSVGNLTVSASLDNYEPFVGISTINKNVTVTFDISMIASTVPLDDVGNVEGIVSDSETGNPLSGVSVSVGSNSILTDSNGAYSFSDLSVGNFNVSASLDNYEPFVGISTINKDVTVILNISMSPVSTAISELNWDSDNWDVSNWQ